MSDQIPAGSGMATPGVVWLPAADTAVYSVSPRQMAPDRLVAVLHEVLHQVGFANELAGGDEMTTEEGVVEAVTQDLRPVWLKRITRRDRAVPVAYGSWVSSVRTNSARATRTKWTSKQAARWRIQLLATPPAQRAALETAAR